MWDAGQILGQIFDRTLLGIGVKIMGGNYVRDFVTHATVTASANITTTPAVKIISANANRRGLLLYNNSANSVYIKYGAAGNSGTDMTVILATFATWVMPYPIFTGDLWGIRNAGSGVVVATELTA